MKLFNRKKTTNIVQLFAILFLSPFIGSKLTFDKLTKEDKYKLDKMAHEWGMHGEEYVALEYELKTGRDLLTDTILSGIVVASTIFILIYVFYLSDALEHIHQCNNIKHT